VGCSTARSSRIGEYRRAFNRLRNASLSKQDLSIRASEQLLQSLVDFEQLRVIRSAWAASHDKAKWAPALQRVAEGCPFPLHANRPEASSGRDFQFECYIAAVLELSGIGSMLDEPDIVITDARFPYRIAAKRPREVASIEPNVRKAKRQLARAGGKGIVALDLSEPLFHGQLVRSSNNSEAAIFAGDIVEGYWRKHHVVLHRMLLRSNAVAVLINFHLPVQTYSEDGRKQLATAFKWIYAILTPPATQEDQDCVMRLTAECEKGLFDGPVKSRL
jgi:hypothetical protein